VNDGTIQTSLNGYIAMLAPEVRNNGLLLAQAGTVAMAAGESITLNFGPTSKLESITVSAAQLNTLVENRYAIKAPNGLVILSARAADQLAASVVNSGTIEAKGVSQQGGRILLEGSTVTNTGTLDASSDSAQGGTIQINGKNISLSGKIVVSSPVQGGTIKALATGQISVVNANIQANGGAQGGAVQIAANAITIDSSNVNADGDAQGGTVQVNAAGGANLVALLGSDHPFNDPLAPPTGPGSAALMGSTSLTTRGRKGQGGTVEITGDDISLNDTTAIDVSGATGGGAVLVGGDWQGSNGVYQATTVTMAQGVTINASASDNGSGGKVVLWSDVTNANGSTSAYGYIYARGGVNGGNGGQVETSGHHLDTAGILVNAGSPMGSGGLWLLDPYDYTVTSTAAGNIVSSLNSNNVIISTASSNTSQGGNASTGSGNVYITSNIATNTNYNLTIQANGAIVVNGGVSIWLNSSSNVTYTASTGTGSLFMGGANVANINSTNWNSGDTSYYAQATAGSQTTNYSGIFLGNRTGTVDIRAGGNLTFAGYNNQAGGYSGITLFSGSNISGGNVSFYAMSTVGTGQQLSWGNSNNITITATAANGTVFLAGQSSYSGATVDNGYGTFLNGAIINGPTVQIIGRNTSGATYTGNINSGIALAWLNNSGQYATINTNLLKLTADTVALGCASVNVNALNGGSFGLNFTSYNAANALTFAYNTGSGTTIATSTAMAMPGSNFNNMLNLPTGTYSSYSYTSNAALTVGANLSATGCISLYGATVNISSALTSSNTGDIWIQGNNAGSDVILITPSGSINKTGGALSNITLQATGSIDLKGNITASNTSGDATLTLQTTCATTSGNNIILNGANITSSSNKLNVVLWTLSEGAGLVNITGSAINTNGGQFWISGGAATTWNGLSGGSANVSNWYAGNAVSITNSNITVGSGNVAINARS
jgi:hypothetical protein